MHITTDNAINYTVVATSPGAFTTASLPGVVISVAVGDVVPFSLIAFSGIEVIEPFDGNVVNVDSQAFRKPVRFFLGARKLVAQAGILGSLATASPLAVCELGIRAAGEAIEEQLACLISSE